MLSAPVHCNVTYVEMYVLRHGNVKGLVIIIRRDDARVQTRRPTRRRHHALDRINVTELLVLRQVSPESRVSFD